MKGETGRPLEGGGGGRGLTAAELRLAWSACRAVRVAGCPPAYVQALLAHALDGLDPWLAEKVARLPPGQIAMVRDWIGRRQEGGEYPCPAGGLLRA